MSNQPQSQTPPEWRTVSSSEELISVLAEESILSIIVMGDLSGLPSLTLRPGVILEGQGQRKPTLSFGGDAEGLILTTDNVLRHLSLQTTANKAAITNDTTVDNLGILEIDDITTTGLVRLFANGSVRGGHVEVRDLHIAVADATAFEERPHGFGVYVLQGAFTLWNQQSEPKVIITANLVNVSAGAPGRPVKGSGIFVAGAGDSGGTLRVQRLQTGPVYSTGEIAAGIADQITGGVFTVSGAIVDLVENAGPVVTYGQNDMVLDNWGVVDRWHASAKITSHGPSGIGFVNFGQVASLVVAAPIETFGKGARGFNVYDGTLGSAEFDRIVTHGDGSVGIQISKPVGTIKVHRGVETFGGTGASLVKGVVQNLSAVALSIKPGGTAKEIRIQGGLRAHGKGIPAMEQLGSVEHLTIEGGFQSDMGSAS